MYNIVKKPLSTSAHKTFCLRGLRRFKPSLKSPSCVVATITKICTNVTSSPFHKKPSGVFNGEGSFYKKTNKPRHCFHIATSAYLIIFNIFLLINN